jgi:hypothetical protein
VTSSRTVLVPPERLARWFENFETRHGTFVLTVADGALVANGSDGTTARAELPFTRRYDGPPAVSEFAAGAASDLDWGLLLVRKGGFAMAVARGARVQSSKVGQRHVQGRTKAGGQSQQRFARRRDNQARQAYEAAAEHAHRLLVADAGPLEALVCGGDRQAVEQVLSDPRLRPVALLRSGPWLAVPDPRRAVLDQAVIDGRSAAITLSEPG